MHRPRAVTPVRRILQERFKHQYARGAKHHEKPPAYCQRYARLHRYSVGSGLMRLNDLHQFCAQNFLFADVGKQVRLNSSSGSKDGRSCIGYGHELAATVARVTLPSDVSGSFEPFDRARHGLIPHLRQPSEVGLASRTFREEVQHNHPRVSQTMCREGFLPPILDPARGCG